MTQAPTFNRFVFLTSLQATPMGTLNIPGGGAPAHEPAAPSTSRRRNDVRETPRASSDRSQETLTKREIAHAVYSVCPGISRRQAKELIDAALEEIISALAIGEDVNLRGFGNSPCARRTSALGAIRRQVSARRSPRAR
jgi:hypothetical protein